MSTDPLVYHHNRITRLIHWGNALALMILLMSGFLFTSHKRLGFEICSRQNAKAPSSER